MTALFLQMISGRAPIPEAGYLKGDVCPSAPPQGIPVPLACPEVLPAASCPSLRVLSLDRRVRVSCWSVTIAAPCGRSPSEGRGGKAT